jgi:RNA polymerase sigma factor (sigma-70 family)
VQNRDDAFDGDTSFAAADVRWDREPQPTPEEELEASEDIERVNTLIREAGLSNRQREVALAYAFEDTTLADVARDLGIAPADARKHWERARPKLREAARRLRIAS